MVRLPPKKSKQKQVVIDFASVESAKNSAPPSYDHESWLEEGIKQEEQGERYQFGNKATRHYTNAVVCFTVAASLDASDFDSRYNAARVLYRLATDHLPPAEAYDALGKAIVGYRQAIEVAQEQTMARIDGMFNLAQAEVALFEMLDEAAVVGVPEGTGFEAAKEAKDLFVQVEALQRREMEKFFGQSSPVEEEDTSVPETAGTEDVQATETVIVTPQLLLDTLLESISLDMSLHSNLASDPSSQAQLLHSAKSTFERAVSLRATYLSDCPPEVDVEMTLAQFSIFSAPSSPEATQVLEGALASTQTPSPSLLSIYADHLVESLPLSQPFDVVGPQLERALSTYQNVQSLLSNRLSPPKDVPSYQIPLLLSSNLLAQSTVQLLSHHIVRSSAAQSQLAATSRHLDTAHSLALESISILKSGLSLTPSSTSPDTLALVRSPPSQEPLSNLSTLLALRSSYFSLIRIRLRQFGDSNDRLEDEKKKFWNVWNALTRNARESIELRTADLHWWIQESEEDKVAECVGIEAASREREWWISLNPQ